MTSNFIAGDLRGKRVLDVGAGTGENSLALGAKVTSIDIFPDHWRFFGNIGISGPPYLDSMKRFAAVRAWSPEEGFDIIRVSAFLHHVLTNLEFVLGQLKRLAGPQGRIIIAEPFAHTPIRRLRLALPIEAGGTPGERPLNLELRLVQGHFPGMQMGHFPFLSRLNRFTPKAEIFAGFDAALLRVPVLKWLGGVIVMWT